MSITVRQLLANDALALKLLAGGAGEDETIRWVHVSELEDPTDWLKGGEVLLTIGLNVGDTPAKQRAYVKRLAGAGLAGLGFGVGFSHKKAPKAIVEAAEKLGFPLFEVPYPTPFIAITEAVSTRVLAEQYDVLHRAVEAQHVLTRAVLDERGVEGIAVALARVINGWALVLDLHGMPLAASSKDAEARTARAWDEIRESRPEGTGFSLSSIDEGHHVQIQPVGAHGRVEAFLAVGKPEQPSAFDRVVAGHALSLLAIELSKERAVADAQRRMQGDFFADLARGGLTPTEASKGLARFGFAPDTQVVVLAVESADVAPPPDPLVAERAAKSKGKAASAKKTGTTSKKASVSSATAKDPVAPLSVEDLAWATEDHLSRSGGAYLISPYATGVHVLVPAGMAAAEAKVKDEVGKRIGRELRVGASSPNPATAVGRALREALYALQVCRLEGWGSAGFEDLGTYRLLLSMADPDALRAFADSLLAPLDGYDADHGGELVSSLRAFLEHNARWETASTVLGVHRHTLRYRMRKVEDLTGRQLASSFDRMEFWLAVRARELQSVQTDL